MSHRSFAKYLFQCYNEKAMITYIFNNVRQQSERSADMTLKEAEDMLSANGISYNLSEFDNEAEYLRHIELFPDVKKTELCKVIAIVIYSLNGEKNIELQFNIYGEEIILKEMRFGEYGFEIFDYNEKTIASDLMADIFDIMRGHLTFIVSNDIKLRRWVSDACFDLRDDDNSFGKPGYQNALRNIQKPKGIFHKLFKAQKQYEIYDWNTYRCIRK